MVQSAADGRKPSRDKELGAGGDIEIGLWLGCLSTPVARASKAL